MKPRLVSLLAVFATLGGGTGALAAAGVEPFDAIVNEGGAANSQYCPPTSQQPGKPKKPGPARCGNPKTKVPPGQAKKNGGSFVPPGQAKKNNAGNAGNGGGKGNGNGGGKSKSKGNGNGNGNGSSQGQSQGNGGGGKGGGKGGKKK